MWLTSIAESGSGTEDKALFLQCLTEGRRLARLRWLVAQALLCVINTQQILVDGSSLPGRMNAQGPCASRCQTRCNTRCWRKDHAAHLAFCALNHLHCCKTSRTCTNSRKSFERDSIRETLLALRECQNYSLRLMHVQIVLQYNTIGLMRLLTLVGVCISEVEASGAAAAKGHVVMTLRLIANGERYSLMRLSPQQVQHLPPHAPSANDDAWQR